MLWAQDLGLASTLGEDHGRPATLGEGLAQDLGPGPRAYSASVVC